MSTHIIYWSATGNTEAMANALASSVKALGADVKIYPVHEATVADLEKATAIALGCPAMGAEILEETEMEPFVESLKNFNWAGKKLALFGSYDWGDGEWMRNWETQMSDFGATLVADGVMAHNAPDESVLKTLEALAQKLV